MDTPTPTPPPALAQRWALVCEVCKPELRFAPDTTMGVIKAHWEIEHGQGDARVECKRVCVCGSTMDHTRQSFKRSGVVKHFYWCPNCQRSERLSDDKVPSWES